MTDPIEVKISGPTNSGKTHVAAIIYNALKAHGFTDVKLECMDGDAQAKIDGLANPNATSTLNLKVLSREVIIEDYNGHRPAKPSGSS